MAGATTKRRKKAGTRVPRTVSAPQGRKRSHASRLPAPRSAGAASRRLWVGVAVGLAVSLAAVLIVANRLGAGDEAPRAAAPAGGLAYADETAALLEGVPQDGAAIGAPDAPVTLVEFADLQCPFCAEWAVRTFPELVHDYVRAGELRIVFRPLAFVGEESDRAARAVVAAGEQDRLWHVVELLYRNQGPENSGWVADDLLAALGPAVPGLDGERMQAAASSAAVGAELERAAQEAERAGIEGTPSFLLGPTDGELVPVTLTSLGPEGIRAKIDELLRP